MSLGRTGLQYSSAYSVLFTRQVCWLQYQMKIPQCLTFRHHFTCWGMTGYLSLPGSVNGQHRCIRYVIVKLSNCAACSYLYTTMTYICHSRQYAQCGGMFFDLSIDACCQTPVLISFRERSTWTAMKMQALRRTKDCLPIVKVQQITHLGLILHKLQHIIYYYVHYYYYYNYPCAKL